METIPSEASLTSMEGHLGSGGVGGGNGGGGAAGVWVPKVSPGVEAHPGHVQVMQRCLRYGIRMVQGILYE